ncbi:MAG: BON domain-containing protein [Steroidobacteraceae bacterium]
MVKQRDESHQPGRVAGEYGEGDARQATGVGPRSKGADTKVLNDEHRYPDNYGNVAPGRYGVYGYSGSPGYAPSVPRGPSAAASGAAGAADERLHELIRERLTEDPGIDAGNVTIEVTGGKVTLSGTVATRHARAEVEQCVENCGAREIQNDLGIA